MGELPPQSRPSRSPSRRPFRLATDATVVGLALIAGVAVMATSCGGNNGRIGSTNAAAAALLLDVSMVPPNGATDQNPATFVVLQAPSSQLVSVEVRAPALKSSLPGTFEAGRHQVARPHGP